MPKVSLIIPCYNQGSYVDEAIASVRDQTYQNYEIIIVNDGSTDQHTIAILNNLRAPAAKVIHTTNQGLASARNNGIRAAAGEYVLPLDADDRIGPTYLEEAVRILDKHPHVGIVYCEAAFFGDKAGRWDLSEFSMEEMLIENIIFCSGMFRRSDWQNVGGYDPEMRHGWEDYDFWLSLLELDVSVYKIPHILFFYRISDSSMLRSASRERKARMFLKIFKKHRKLYNEHISLCTRKALGLGRISPESIGQTDPFIGISKEPLRTSYRHVSVAQMFRREKPGILLRNARIYFRQKNMPSIACPLILLTLLWKRIYYYFVCHFHIAAVK